LPKVQSINLYRLHKFLGEFASEVFKTDGKILYKIIGDQVVPGTKCFQAV